MTQGQRNWTIVYLVNLIVPLQCGLAITQNGGVIGMLIAVALYWLIGIFACIRGRSVMRAVTAGGLIVGISQVFPLLQMFVGYSALRLFWPQAIDFDPRYTGPVWDIPVDLRGFIVTMATGGALLTAAMFCGYCILALLSVFRPDEDYSSTVKRSAG